MAVDSIGSANHQAFDLGADGYRRPQVRLTDGAGNALNPADIPAATLYEATLVASGAVSAVATPAAGFHLEIYRLEAQAGADGAQTVAWREGVGGTDKYKALLLLTGDIISRRLNGSWHLATATALYVNPSSANSVRVLVEYRTVAD